MINVWLLLLLLLFALDHLLIQYFIRGIEQGFRRSSLLTDKAEKRWRCMKLCFPVSVRGVD